MECEYAISTVEAAFLHVKVKVYFKVKVTVLTILSVSLDFNPVSAPICVIKRFVYQARARNIFMPFAPPPLFLCSLSFTLIIYGVVKSTPHGESHS